MKKLVTISIPIVLFAVNVYGKGGAHMKACKVKCSPHVKLAFPKVTTTTDDDNRKKKIPSPKPADWPWWLPY